LRDIRSEVDTQDVPRTSLDVEFGRSHAWQWSGRWHFTQRLPAQIQSLEGFQEFCQLQKVRINAEQYLAEE